MVVTLTGRPGGRCDVRERKGGGREKAGEVRNGGGRGGEKGRV